MLAWSKEARSNQGWLDTRPRRHWQFRRRLLLALPLIPLLFFLSKKHDEYRAKKEYYNLHGLPDYTPIREYERSLPQHNPDLPFPEGRNGRYLRFTHQLWNIGFNNVLQEIILLSHLAYLSNRAFVFQPYIWLYEGPVAVQDGHGGWRSYQIPLNAFISGASAGGPMPINSTAPRAVSLDYWDDVCPPENRFGIDVNVVHREEGLDKHSESMEFFDKWLARLAEIPASCIEIKEGHIFDFDTIGHKQILSSWPSLVKSPILTHFRWSPLVLNAVARNLHLVSSAATFESTDPRHAAIPDPSSINDNSIIRGLVAIHLRRGDYDWHCENLANWISTYTGWNQFPEYVDQFVPPNEGGQGSHTPNSLALYMKHCWPTFEQVRQKLAQVRRETVDGENLERVFILTNGDAQWTSQMKRVLLDDGWKKVVSSKDIMLTAEEVEIDGPVDMQLAIRAEVFVGNGFSSLTSNINMLRLVHGSPMDNIRFW